MGGFVVPGKMAGPPTPPPGTPTLTGYGAARPPQPQQSAGVLRIIHAVEQTLDTIARTVPDVSEQVDRIKGILTEIMNKAALSPTPNQGMEPKQEEQATGAPPQGTPAP